MSKKNRIANEGRQEPAQEDSGMESEADAVASDNPDGLLPGEPSGDTPDGVAAQMPIPGPDAPAVAPEERPVPGEQDGPAQPLPQTDAATVGNADGGVPGGPSNQTAFEPVLVFEATLIPRQLLHGAVRLEVMDKQGDAPMQDQLLTFDRGLLPDDYDWLPGAVFALKIARVK